MNNTDYTSLLNNKLLKERSRLLILCFLLGSETNSATFMVLQKALNLSRGNLSVQIKMLKEADYLSIDKSFKNNKPQTMVTITNEGIGSLRQYLKEMEMIITSTYDVKE